MSDRCYAMVRGSALRVTGLTPKGAVPGSGPISYVASRSAVKVSLDEITEDLADETLRDSVDRPRLHLPGSSETIGFSADMDFLKVDPGLVHLMTGAPLALNAAGDVVGFDSQTRLPVVSFALEVWSKLAGAICADGQKWGYTLLPFLKGGYLSGFTFGNGLVSFGLRGATTRRGSRWNVGPYDLEGPWERLLTPVSRNDAWVNLVTSAEPPEDTCGIVEFEDVVDNGTAGNPMPIPDAPAILDGGSASDAGPGWIVDGGGA